MTTTSPDERALTAVLHMAYDDAALPPCVWTDVSARVDRRRKFVAPLRLVAAPLAVLAVVGIFVAVGGRAPHTNIVPAASTAAAALTAETASYVSVGGDELRFHDGAGAVGGRFTFDGVEFVDIAAGRLADGRLVAAAAAFRDGEEHLLWLYPVTFGSDVPTLGEPVPLDPYTQAERVGLTLRRPKGIVGYSPARVGDPEQDGRTIGEVNVAVAPNGDAVLVQVQTFNSTIGLVHFPVDAAGDGITFGDATGFDVPHPMGRLDSWTRPGLVTFSGSAGVRTWSLGQETTYAVSNVPDMADIDDPDSWALRSFGSNDPDRPRYEVSRVRDGRVERFAGPIGVGDAVADSVYLEPVGDAGVTLLFADAAFTGLLRDGEMTWVRVDDAVSVASLR